MPRPYRKLNQNYWSSRAPKSTVAALPPPPSITNVPGNTVAQAAAWEVEAEWDGQPHYSARAACGGGAVTTTQYRDGIAPSAISLDQYPNIRSGLLPYAVMEGGYYGVSEVVTLCYIAFYNFAILRNAIKLLRDFSVSPIHVKTTNQRVKTFIETWLETIGYKQFLNQFFLEYYRSGNVFVYRFNGQIDDDRLTKLKQAYAGEITAASGVKVPIRYVILNPMQIYLQMGPTAPSGYVRMLSTYEIARLRNPQTPEDEQILDSFPPAVRRQIKNTGTVPYLYVPLDPKRLVPVFYDKADYEPLAVPMAFPVLNDIEYKLELRRMDIALASTIERVILLVTTGRPADQYNQVPPKSNLQNLQDIFRNQTIGRVLVADYTTDAKWVIPDLKELLGKGKYEQVDKDIKEGLQYMFFGDEKFANASIKVDIFIEGLKEGRRAFLETFLMPEVRKVCEDMGFRHVPTLEFEEIQMKDEALMARLFVQMAQLGLLTDSELNEALRTGMLPTKEESVKNQEEYKAQRKKGLYTPLAPEKPEPGSGSSVSKGRPGGSSGTPATRKVATPIGQKKVRTAALDEAFASDEGDVLRESRFRFGIMRIGQNLVAMNPVRAAVEEALAKKLKMKTDDLGPDEKEVAAGIAQCIVFNEDSGKDGRGWIKAIPAYLKTPKMVPEAVANEMNEIRATFHSPENPVDAWMAGVLLRSVVDEPKG